MLLFFRDYCFFLVQCKSDLGNSNDSIFVLIERVEVLEELEFLLRSQNLRNHIRIHHRLQLIFELYLSKHYSKILNFFHHDLFFTVSKDGILAILCDPGMLKGLISRESFSIVFCEKLFQKISTERRIV